MLLVRPVYGLQRGKCWPSVRYQWTSKACCATDRVDAAFQAKSLGSWTRCLNGSRKLSCVIQVQCSGRLR